MGLRASGGFELAAAAGILASSSGELLFEGSLLKQRFEVSRLYKTPWKLRFLRLYPDRLEYGKWNKKGVLVLRRGSPVHLNHTLTVSVDNEGYGACRARLGVLRVDCFAPLNPVPSTWACLNNIKK
jgi:hypothetical protein